MSLHEQNILYINDSRNSGDTVFKLCDLADLYNQNVVQLGLLEMKCTKHSKNGYSLMFLICERISKAVTDFKSN